MRITDVGDGYWDFEHEDKHFTVRRVGGDGPDWAIDEKYWCYTDRLLSRLGMTYLELATEIDTLIEETEKNEQRTNN